MSDKSPIDRQWDLGAAVMSIALCDETRQMAVITAAGEARLLPFDNGDLSSPIALHKGASLSLARGITPGTFVSGGEDGRLVSFAGDGNVAELALHKGKWLEHLAVAPRLGQIFYAVGKEVHRL